MSNSSMQVFVSGTVSPEGIMLKDDGRIFWRDKSWNEEELTFEALARAYVKHRCGPEVTAGLYFESNRKFEVHVTHNPHGDKHGVSIKNESRCITIKIGLAWLCRFLPHRWYYWGWAGDDMVYLCRRCLKNRTEK